MITFNVGINSLRLCDADISQWTGAIIASGNGLSPVRRQATTWTNADLLLIGPSETHFSEISIEIQTFSLKKIRLKMSSATKSQPFVSASMCIDE